jgi:hypothetical protein
VVAPGRYFMALLMALLLSGGSATLHAHQDACHRLHSCPSDHNTYICGDTGRCEQCPDNRYCLAGKPRQAAPLTSAPEQPVPTSTQPSQSGGTTVCFTPGRSASSSLVSSRASSACVASGAGWAGRRR